MTGSGRFITAVLLLSSLGFFAVTAQAQDCSRPVGDNMDLKGNDIHQNSFPDGTTVTFECNIGYVSAGGSPSVTCAAGSWSPVRLKCERKNCGAVEEVDNGQIHYDPGTEFGDKAVLICNPGYRAVGRGDLICGDQGWLGRLPVCEVIKCESPPVVQDGSFSPNKDIYEYNEVIQYTCKKDYTLDGSRQLHCSDDTTFKPEPPRCIKVECGDPEIPFGQWSSGARPPYGYLSTVTLQCNAGYKMNGTATVTCGLNSQWSPGLPQCIPVECGDPEISFGQWHSGARPPYGYKSTVTLQCNTGYTMIGAATVMCELNSQWSPGLPQCILPFAEGCEDPKKRSAEVTVSSQPPYRHGVKVTLSCPPGYKLNGPDSQTCEKNGLWSPGIPLCTLDNGNGSSTGVVIGILVGVGAVLGIGFGGFMWHKKNGEKGKRKHDSLATPQLLAVKTAS